MIRGALVSMLAHTRHAWNQELIIALRHSATNGGQPIKLPLD